MRRKITALVGVSVLFLFALTAVTSGERVTSKIKGSVKTKKQSESIPSTETTNKVSEQAAAKVDPNEPQPPVAAGPDAYDIPWQSINAGGDDMQSANYQMLSSVGQSVIGYASSDNYQAGIGYWYGMAAGEECFCGGAPPAFGDITCDAAVNPIDVVKMVNYVYKNIDDRCSTDWNCPKSPGDVNCDDAVNPVDVVRYVNYVYKNITPFPCDPCSP